ncbi:hypothetical protein [Actinoplanes sp. NPDC051851]|uniref:hypothetical protein n=1 Tax=Actinoplanes sp. NPDC051851 TaxID=3154753 RepID=UPI0034394D56
MRWTGRFLKDWRSALLGVYWVGALIGTVANGIQILTAGRATTEGLVIAAFIIFAAALPLAYQIGRRTGGAAVPHDDLLGQVKDADNTRRVLGGTLGTYRPYSEDWRIIFDIGESKGDDTVEEIHTTRPYLAERVYWCLFEAFNRGRDHQLGWEDIDLHVTRPPASTGEPQQVKVVKLDGKSVPRALITFAPPHHEVTWMASYRAPGYWDPLRQSAHVQYFEWLPPAVGLDEDGDRRSPVGSAVFVFRVPNGVGTLVPQGLPPGVTFREKPNGLASMREYEFSVAAETIAQAMEPIGWNLRLKRMSLA